MNNEDILKALDGSIEHWENVRDGIDEGVGIKTCPLCKLFFDNVCEGCPIREYSGCILCKQTPYEYFVNHFDNNHSMCCRKYRVLCSECVRLANEEVKFLNTVKKNFEVSLNKPLQINLNDAVEIKGYEGHVYIVYLCEILEDRSGRVVLIGNSYHTVSRMTDAIVVQDVCNITSEEIYRLTGGSKILRVIDRSIVNEHLFEGFEHYLKGEGKL